jgi:hypothetical protein
MEEQIDSSNQGIKTLQRLVSEVRQLQSDLTVPIVLGKLLPYLPILKHTVKYMAHSLWL